MIHLFILIIPWIHFEQIAKRVLASILRLALTYSTLFILWHTYRLNTSEWTPRIVIWMLFLVFNILMISQVCDTRRLTRAIDTPLILLCCFNIEMFIVHACTNLNTCYAKERLSADKLASPNTEITLSNLFFVSESK